MSIFSDAIKLSKGFCLSTSMFVLRLWSCAVDLCIDGQLSIRTWMRLRVSRNDKLTNAIAFFEENQFHHNGNLGVRLENEPVFDKGVLSVNSFSCF